VYSIYRLTKMAAIVTLTECPVCLERLVNPKLLPCSHTFCLQCLWTLYTRRNGSDRGRCPLCRSTFNPPNGDCSRLPTNVFAEKLVRMSKQAEETGQCLEIQHDEIKSTKTEHVEKLRCEAKTPRT